MSSYWPNSHAGSEHTIKQPQVLRKICLTWLKSWHTRFNVFSFFRRLLYHGGAITIRLNTEFLHIISLKLSVVVYDYIEMFSADESDSTAMLPVGGRLRLHSWIHPVTISQVGWPSSTSLQVLQRAILFFFFMLILTVSKITPSCPSAWETSVPLSILTGRSVFFLRCLRGRLCHLHLVWFYFKKKKILNRKKYFCSSNPSSVFLLHRFLWSYLMWFCSFLSRTIKLSMWAYAPSKPLTITRFIVLENSRCSL